MNSTYRIGIDARLIAYRDGGIAEYTRRLIAQLPDQDAHDRFLLMQHARAKEPLSTAPNVRRITVYTPPHHRLEKIAFAAEIKRLRLDLLHSPDFIPPLCGARRYVITIHDLNFLLYPQFQTPDSLRYYAGQLPHAVRQAHHILADSQATKDDICNLLSVNADKVTVHYLAAHPIYRPLPTDQIAPVRKRLGLAATYILFVGTFEPRKNLSGLLSAYRILRGQLPDAPPLVIAGRRGWLYEDIFQQVNTLGLTDHVQWLENVGVDDLPAVYNSAAVLTLPSFYEGFGMPPLEAMACGVPTVVSGRGSLPEVVGDTGLLVDPDRPDSIADGLFKALSDTNFRQQSRIRGLERARMFTWQQTASITLRIYQQVLNQS